MPAVFKPPELLACDCMRYIQKVAAAATINSSEESLLSMDSLDSPTVTRVLRKRRVSLLLSLNQNCGIMSCYKPVVLSIENVVPN